MFNIVCSNIRGLERGLKFPYIGKLIIEGELSIVGLVETKHTILDRKRIRRVWGNDEFAWCDVKACDSDIGGIISIWDLNGFVKRRGS